MALPIPALIPTTPVFCTHFQDENPGRTKGALMLIPSTAVESMGMGGLLGAAAMRQSQLSEKQAASGS